MRVLHFLDQTLESLFLRMFAKNLRRSYRNDAENACSDAEIQLSTILLMLIGVVLLILGAVFFPAHLKGFLLGGDLKYIFLIALAIAVVYGVHQRFDRYVHKVELAREYASSRNSWHTMIVYWLAIVGIMLIIWMVLLPLSH